MEHVLQRAQARGEIAADRDIDLDIDALLGIIYYRILVRRMPITSELAGECVSVWYAGVTPSP